MRERVGLIISQQMVHGWLKNGQKQGFKANVTETTSRKTRLLTPRSAGRDCKEDE